MTGTAPCRCLQDLGGGHLDLLDRDREADADVAALVGGDLRAERGDRGVDPDHLALQVDQRATGVAGVDRGVGLHGVDVGVVVLALARGDRPVDRADDAGGHRGREAERRADRDHGLADPHLVGRADGGRLESLGLRHVEHGDVVDRAAADHGGLDVVAVLVDDLDRAVVLVGLGDHVVVGDDVALRRRARSPSRWPPGPCRRTPRRSGPCSAAPSRPPRPRCRCRRAAALRCGARRRGRRPDELSLPVTRAPAMAPPVRPSTRAITATMGSIQAGTFALRRRALRISGDRVRLGVGRRVLVALLVLRLVRRRIGAGVLLPHGLVRVVLGHSPYLDLRTLIGLALVSAPVGDPTGPLGDRSPRMFAGEGRAGTSPRLIGPPATVTRPSRQAPTAPPPTRTTAVRRRRERFSMASTVAHASTSYSEPSSCGGGSTREGADRVPSWRLVQPSCSTRRRQPGQERTCDQARSSSAGRELAVDQGRDLAADVTAQGQHHRTCPAVRPGFRRGPAKRVRPAVGARWARAARSWARPRWMRERTVPSLRPSTSAISS